MRTTFIGENHYEANRVERVKEGKEREEALE